MTHHELIAKAREHATAFERGSPFAVRVSEFSKTRVREAAIICFGSDERDDYIEIYLERDTGGFITALYSPGSSPDTNNRRRNKA
jgi:hypothetical protein